MRQCAGAVVVEFPPKGGEAIATVAPVAPLLFFSESEEALICESLPVILSARPDLFHKTWLRAIRKSPRLNEIIALNQYCVRDLTKWPKLNNISVQQVALFHTATRQGLTSPHTVASIQALGARHHKFSSFGFQPVHFDIWVQSFTEVLATVRLPEELDKAAVQSAWEKLTKLVCEWLLDGYNQYRRSNMRKTTKLTSSTPHA